MRPFLLIVILVVLQLSVHAQTDSLENVLQQANSNQTRFTLNSSLGKAFLNKQPQKALNYFNAALKVQDGATSVLKISEVLKDKGTAHFYLGAYDSTLMFWRRASDILPHEAAMERAGMYNNLAVYFQRVGEVDSSLTYNHKALEIRKNFPDTVLQAHSLGNMGALYRGMGEYGQALRYYFRALKVYDQFNELLGKSSMLNSIGLVYENMKNYDLALDYIQQALAIRRNFDNPRLMAGSINNLAIIYQDREEYDSAIVYLKEYLRYTEQISSRRGAAQAYANLGSIYKNRGQKDSSFWYYNAAWSIFTDINDPESIASCAINLGSLSLSERNPVQALRYYKLALGSAEKTKSLRLQQLIQNGLAQCYEKLGQYHRAFGHVRRYAVLRDSTFREDLSEQIAKYQKKYEVEKYAKEVQILENRLIVEEKEGLLREKNALERERKLELSRTHRNVAIVVSALAVVLLALLFNRYQLRKKLFVQREELLGKEREEYRLKAEFRQNEVDLKNRELSSMATSALHKSELFAELKEEVNALKVEDGKDIVRLQRMLKRGLNLDADWESFQKHFLSVHPDFFNHLRQINSGLTGNDLRICAYLRMNLSNKEIASMMNITPQSARMNKYRLKKKLNLSEETELTDFIIGLTQN